jgi:hypothetical protein
MKIQKLPVYRMERYQSFSLNLPGSQRQLYPLAQPCDIAKLQCMLTAVT